MIIKIVSLDYTIRYIYMIKDSFLTKKFFLWMGGSHVVRTCAVERELRGKCTQGRGVGVLGAG